MKKSKTRWRSCNVLQPGAEYRRLWHFQAARGGFKLEREADIVVGQPLPLNAIKKDWHHLIQPRLNIALLSSDKVFLRVVHLPRVEFSETVDMVELQMEKLSPLPVAQVVWTMHALPHPSPELQTVVVTIVARSLVEDYLGQLEGEGYLADRLEISLFDQILATPIAGEGAWIYPDDAPGKAGAMVAWWYGGALQYVGVINLPDGDAHSAVLKDQLAQMIWAGEVEGWLTSPPAWHLVAEETTADEWMASLKEALGVEVRQIEPLASTDVVGMTARRAAAADRRVGLLPTEYSTRYQQRLVDQVWMRALGAVIAVYLVLVLFYFAGLQVITYQTNSVKNQVKALGPTYTNAITLKQKYEILKEREELKYAALDCWRAVAQTLPVELTMEGLDLKDGYRFTVNGTMNAEDASRLTDFYEDLGREKNFNDRPLFKRDKSTPPNYRVLPGGKANWNMTLEVNRPEGP